MCCTFSPGKKVADEEEATNKQYGRDVPLCPYDAILFEILFLVITCIIGLYNM